MDEAAIAFGGARGGSGLEEESGLTLFGEEGAGGAAFLGLAVERLRDGGGAADFAEGEDVDFVKAAFGLDGEPIADADLARGTQRLTFRLDAIQVAGLRGEGAGFEEARGPEPFVETHGDSVNAAGS
jgi:hypothetical protein